MIETKAVGPSARGSGRRSNFSISGKLTSTCGLPLARCCSISWGRRCRVCGPNTKSTYGARLTMASPSWLATQPPTPISTGLPSFLCCFQRPAILAESYSFIWQPWVLMKSFGGVGLPLMTGDTVVREARGAIV